MTGASVAVAGVPESVRVAGSNPQTRRQTQREDAVRQRRVAADSFRQHERINRRSSRVRLVGDRSVVGKGRFRRIPRRWLRRLVRLISLGGIFQRYRRRLDIQLYGVPIFIFGCGFPNVHQANLFVVFLLTVGEGG